MDRYGWCMKFGEIVEEVDGFEYKCVCDGSFCLVVVEGKCFLEGKCYECLIKDVFLKVDSCLVLCCVY